MKNVWAPWRMEYVQSDKDEGCVFCNAPAKDDQLIITKSELCYAIMNRFPYTSGHCMVAPYRHTGDICDLSDEEMQAVMQLNRRIIAAIRETMQPHGFNIGFNIGTAAGAGFADHLHLHIVPRWSGDTNFMPVLGDTHVISEHIAATCRKISKAL